MSQVHSQDYSQVPMPTHGSQNPALIAREDSYAFHKNIYRSNKFDELTRKNSARWLISNGVVFDNGRAIDPERLPK